MGVETKVSSARNRVENYFEGVLGESPRLDEVDVVIGKLPTYVAFDERTKEYIPVGKVFGAYVPQGNVVVIDPIVFSELADPERMYFDVPPAERVIGEEYFHAGQHKLGLLGYRMKKLGSRKARDLDEGEAATISDELFGETRIYPREKRLYREYVNRCGRRALLEGKCNMN